MSAKSIYHRLVPYGVRAPLGLARRNVADRLRRAVVSTPLPPRELLAATQITPWVDEYLTAGRRAALAIERVFDGAGLAASASARVLDFGAGPARVARHLTRTAWEIHACDWDERAVQWATKALPRVHFTTIENAPPLPWPGETFDAAFAATAFIRLGPADRSAWADELARVVRTGGLLA
ncbi:MAG: methyltransferase domain-containing protein, partial [Thermoanaerobaculia bacterium]